MPSASYSLASISYRSQRPAVFRGLIHHPISASSRHRQPLTAFVRRFGRRTAVRVGYAVADKFGRRSYSAHDVYSLSSVVDFDPFGIGEYLLQSLHPFPPLEQFVKFGFDQFVKFPISAPVFPSLRFGDPCLRLRSFFACGRIRRGFFRLFRRLGFRFLG